MGSLFFSLFVLLFLFLVLQSLQSSLIFSVFLNSFFLLLILHPSSSASLELHTHLQSSFPLILSKRKKLNNTYIFSFFSFVAFLLYDFLFFVFFFFYLYFRGNGRTITKFFVSFDLFYILRTHQ